MLYPPRSLPAPPPEAVGTKKNKEFENQIVSRDKKDHPPPQLQPFDPNRIELQDWVEMGLPERTAKTIGNYLAKGGRFRRAEDLRKIWGMDSTDCDRLIPYVRIEDPAGRKGAYYSVGAGGQYGRVFNPTIGRTISDRTDGNRKRVLLDINRSDSAQWESLPGIGPGYARRILRYRERLGGFVNKQQVGETYLLPDSVFQRVLPYLSDHFDERIHWLPLNSISIDSLGRHPYCGFTKARLIVRYREQHGPFSHIEDLLIIESLDEEWLSRIRPYLNLQ